MDVFENSIDPHRFRSINNLWNETKLNDFWSVGIVVNIITDKVFNNKEDWETYYYASGDKRNTELNNLSDDLIKKLNDERLPKKNWGIIKSMEQDLIDINYDHGRTKEQLKYKGKILFEEAIERGIDITENECIQAVRYRTICETWNGIIVREGNTVKKLRQKFKDVEFVSTDGQFDFDYAVDYEIKLSGNLICGIQIKPKSYDADKPYLRKAKYANKKKNDRYSDEFGKPVLYVFSKLSGEIINKEIENEISHLINAKLS